MSKDNEIEDAERRANNVAASLNGLSHLLSSQQLDPKTQNEVAILLVVLGEYLSSDVKTSR
ncbi:hypothetical protein HG263_05520 [Pseudoalteromonas sp. JBTF-M23]|uniref:Uncharacterized protein n=1 Tax=Pseudoalteromonas caenipelagi TaxID=2726988 RepID=A0A849VAL6_9GAMM|nr:hypothetical protein [Pseudoalteromonas caenipelagi]NOU49995.1 hypothetical protein [Pseudoalteromonas caenipelagi]